MNGKKVMLSLFLMVSFLKIMPMNGPDGVLVYGSEGAEQTIDVPVAILMESPVIKSMIEDVGIAQAIPLAGSIKVIQDVVEILKNPSVFDQMVGNYSLDDLIERFTFLNHYDIGGNILTLFKNEIAKKGVGVKAPLNNDVKKRLFIDPAMVQLKNVMIQKQSTDDSEFTQLETCNRWYDLGSIVFTPDGKIMFTGLTSGIARPTRSIIHRWSLDNGDKIERVYNEILSNLRIKSADSLAINKSGSILAAGITEDEDVYNVLIWQLDNSGNITTAAEKLKQSAGRNKYIAFHPNGNMIVAEDKSLYLWTSNGNGGFSEQPQLLKNFSRDISDLKISSNGKVMVVASPVPYQVTEHEDSLLLWTFNHNGIIDPNPQSLAAAYDKSRYLNIALNKEGTMLITTTPSDDGIYIWNLEDLKNIKRKKMNGIENSSRVVLSHDGEKFAITQKLGIKDSISIYNINGDVIKEGFTSPGLISNIQFSPDNEKLILCLKKELRVWSLIKEDQKNLLANLSKTLTADQAQVILKLSRAARAKDQEVLSDDERKIYDTLSPVVQALFKDNIR